MKNIALTGFMGTGKTAIGRYLSKRLGYSFIDIDREIEKKTGQSITDIFNIQGEEAFRDMESEAIAAAAKQKNAVISTGGGSVIRQQNIDRLRENGIIVCLKALPETILARVQNNRDRPLLNADDPLKRIKELMAERESYYHRADLIINTDGLSPAQVVDEILRNISDRNG